MRLIVASISISRGVPARPSRRGRPRSRRHEPAVDVEQQRFAEPVPAAITAALPPGCARRPAGRNSAPAALGTATSAPWPGEVVEDVTRRSDAALGDRGPSTATARWSAAHLVGHAPGDAEVPRVIARASTPALRNSRIIGRGCRSRAW
jgi:hypothetical protein